ncbi:hypothetical protein CDAR_533011 [Caerostris darwini]|uniref:Uncharacterized protein n=1 Tax=Caerostris darwini TaxID=1538125 RepID=A0AAV4N3D8_9ARAC|nr:hypothetical protein CDAR_533011 [Caerostris darwini]
MTYDLLGSSSFQEMQGDFFLDEPIFIWPPAPDPASPESPPLHEQGIIPADDPPSMMDVTLTVTREQLNDNNFLSSHPAPHKVLEPSIEHLLFFEELLKEAASLCFRYRSTKAPPIISAALPGHKPQRK